MDPNYARHYTALFERHWWWRAREVLILATLEKLSPRRDWGFILDVGCGDGLLFERLEGFGHVEGIEMDSTGMSTASRWAERIHLQAFDATFRPAHEYGLILMLDVLEHLVDPVSSLRRGVELLRPHGRILITVPAFPGLWTSHDDLNHHYRRYTRRSLRDLARAAGAEVVSERYFFHWLTPVKLVVHFKERILPATPSVPRVPSRWVNKWLYHLSVFEHRVLGKLGLPFGTSLLVVAKKNGGS